MPPLPLELITLIIEEIGLNDDVITLRTCIGVCRSFLDPCRRFLFYKITLDDRRSSQHRRQRCLRFHEVVSHNPKIASYVRELKIVDDLDTLTDTSKPSLLSTESDIIASMLKLFTLRSFTLSCDPGYIYWSSMSEDLNHSLMQIFEQPSLIYLCLQNIRGISFIQLKAFMPHTRILELSNVGFKGSLHEDNEAYISTMDFKLESLTLQFMHSLNSRLIINVMEASPHLRLQRLAITTNDVDNLKFAQKIMQVCHNSITELAWIPSKTSSYLGASLNEVDISILCNLRSLIVLVSFPAHQPLAELFHLVMNIPAESQISNITIEFLFDRITNVAACEETLWRSLDAIFARPQFCGLQQLNLRLSPFVMARLKRYGLEDVNQSVIVLLNGLLPKARARGLVSVQIKE